MCNFQKSHFISFLRHWSWNSKTIKLNEKEANCFKSIAFNAKQRPGKKHFVDAFFLVIITCLLWAQFIRLFRWFLSISVNLLVPQCPCIRSFHLEMVLNVWINKLWIECAEHSMLFPGCLLDKANSDMWIFIFFLAKMCAKLWAVRNHFRKVFMNSFAFNLSESHSSFQSCCWKNVDFLFVRHIYFQWRTWRAKNTTQIE